MNFYRKVKFEYFQIMKRNKNEKREKLFDLTKWMEVANNISLEKRSKEYRGERARLEEAYLDQDLDYFFLHFVRLRATNVPSKAKLDTNVEPFELEDDEYLGEEVSALYDSNKNILMLQRNKFSLGPSGIEEYLNLIWPNEDEDILVTPIPVPNAFELAKKPKVYRKINIRMANIDKKVSENLLDKFKSPLGKVIKTYGEYDGVNAQVTITVGNGKENQLDEDIVRTTINDIEDNKDLFTKAEISARDNDESPVEVIDLFDGLAHDFATFRLETRGSLNHYSVADAMHTIYHPEKQNRQAEIKSYLR